MKNESQQQSSKLIAANLVGTMLELYDISIYGYFAPYIASNFFPNQSHNAGLVSTFAIFFISFIVRPLGSIFWGYLGDTIGRKQTLVLTIAVMTVATCGIGLLPTTNQIGLFAPALLIACRIFQGLSFSGEFIGSLLFLLEQAPQNRKSFFASWSTCGGNVGLLLASFVCWAVSHFCSQTDIVAWGWRIPFMLGSVGGVICFYLRSHISEKTVLKKETRHAFPLVDVFKKQKRAMLELLSISCFYMVVCYLIYVWSSTGLSYLAHMSTSRALGINSLALALQILLIPHIAALSDRIGKKPILLAGIAGLSIFIYPYYVIIQHASVGIILLAHLSIAFIAAPFTTLTPVYIAELIPQQLRFSGVALGYNIAGALTGGSSLWVAMKLIQLPFGTALLSAYVVLWASIAFLAITNRNSTVVSHEVMLTN